MAASKNALIREMVIDRCLSDFKHLYSTREMMDLCNKALMDEGAPVVTAMNTIRTDIDGICNRWKVNVVEIKRGRNRYYRYEDEGFSIYKSPLTEEELTQLSQTLMVLERFHGLPQFEWVSELNARFKSTLMMNVSTNQVIGFEENIDAKGKEHIAPLFDAIVHKQPLKLTYQRFSSSEPRVYVVHPYYLKQYRNMWYLLCFYEGHAGITTFALDRIVGYEPAKVVFVENEMVDFLDYFDKAIGVSVDNEKDTERIRLWVDKMQYRYFETKPLHGTQRVVERRNDGVVIEIDVQRNYELIQLILSFGNAIEVLAPDGLRQEVIARLKGAVERYG
ncbi:MAG: WYL domain-containing protein [Bacteroides sp.]|nr:WYL domain-containing protein [Bacteroides sp.]